MPIVWNPTQENIEVKVVGKWFSFKPGNKKVMQDGIAHFIATDRKETGLTVLPPEFEEEADFEKSELGKEMLEKLKTEAIEHLVRHHRAIIANNQISLRQDLEKSNIKADPAIYASPGELKSMQLVAKYQRAQQDAEQQKMDQVKKLMKEVSGK